TQARPTRAACRLPSAECAGEWRERLDAARPSPQRISIRAVSTPGRHPDQLDSERTSIPLGIATCGDEPSASPGGVGTTRTSLERHRTASATVRATIVEKRISKDR